MSMEVPLSTNTGEETTPFHHNFRNSGFVSSAGIYHSLIQLDDNYKITSNSNVDTATFILSQFPHPDLAESRVALVDSATDCRVTYAKLRRSILKLASGLYHALGIRKGDVVFLLSPNSLLYPTICFAIFSLGAILSPANPINTEAEIIKQVRDSGAKLIISAPEELHKFRKLEIPKILTIRELDDVDLVSIEELIQCCDSIELPKTRIAQSDTAAILYSSGTTGTSKGVVLTHSNFISIMTLLRWTVDVTQSQNDTFLCFIPMFHIYGLAFFGLGLFCCGVTTVLMQKFEFGAMVEAIKAYQVNNIPAVPPVILGLVKYSKLVNGCDLSSVRRVGSGAAPLSKEVADAFRERFPWAALRPGYGLTESCGAATFFANDTEAKVKSGSCGKLLPSFSAKVVDIETGLALPPGNEGELWLKSPTIMKCYLGNEEATATTLVLLVL